MKDKKRQDRRGKPHSDASEIGVVRVFSNPGPDAEDRLRRLFSLLVKYATQDREAAPEKDSPSDSPHTGDGSEEEG